MSYTRYLLVVSILTLHTNKKSKKNIKLIVIGKTKKRGTKIHFIPDNQILETDNFSYDILIRRLRELAFLNKGVKLIIEDERSDKKDEFFCRSLAMLRS